MRRTLLITGLLCTMQAWSMPFCHTYKGAPLYEVLQDIEAHFDCSFLYRVQDIASAPAVTATFNTNNYNDVLRHALGEALMVTARKNILIITPAPPKPVVTEQPQPVVAVSAVDTLLIAHTYKEQPDTSQENIAYLPKEMLRPSLEPFYSHIDTFKIAHFVQSEQFVISSQLSAISNQQSAGRYLPRTGYLKHSFLTALSVGYGSELNAQLDLEYVFFFHKNWGFNTGFALDYAGQYSTSWAHEMRFALPLALRTQWMFTPLWGLQGATGIQVWFPMADPNGTEAQPFAIASNSVDMAVYAELDAAYVLSQRVTLLFGLYGRFSALSTALTPWSAGLHVGFQIGK